MAAEPNAINQALTQAGIAATDIQGIVHNLGAETVQSLEWYQTTQTIWPRRVSEQQRMAVQMGEKKSRGQALNSTFFAESMGWIR